MQKTAFFRLRGRGMSENVVAMLCVCHCTLIQKQDLYYYCRMAGLVT